MRPAATSHGQGVLQLLVADLPRTQLLLDRSKLVAGLFRPEVHRWLHAQEKPIAPPCCEPLPKAQAARAPHLFLREEVPVADLETSRRWQSTCSAAPQRGPGLRVLALAASKRHPCAPKGPVSGPCTTDVIMIWDSTLQHKGETHLKPVSSPLRHHGDGPHRPLGAQAARRAR